MRTLVLAAMTMVTAFGASSADAQRLGGAGGQVPGASYPVPGPGQSFPNQPIQQQQGQQQQGQRQQGQRQQGMPHRPFPGPGGPGGPGQANGSRWGGTSGGHWSGGMNAPGGWNAYRRPTRGYRLPGYWTSPSFFIGDFAGYGLYAPPSGYGWQRYYDDAVLVDSRGKVRDWTSGLDWDGAYGGDDYGYADGGAYAAGGPGYPPRHSQYRQLPPVSHRGNVTTYTTSSGYAQGGYSYGSGYGAGGGYYYPGATTTVVTIEAAPVTTTTTEYVEETRTRTRTHYVAPRRVYHAPKRVYRPAPCSCRRKAAPVEKPIQGS